MLLLLLLSFMLLLLQNPTILSPFQVKKWILPYQWKVNLQNKTHKYQIPYLQT